MKTVQIGHKPRACIGLHEFIVKNGKKSLCFSVCMCFLIIF